MTKATVNSSALQALVNSHAAKKAEAQYRLARLFTPYMFEPEQVDFNRVGGFLDNIDAAFPQPTESISRSLERIENDIAEANAILTAFEGQGISPTLSGDELFQTAQQAVAFGNLPRYANA